MEKLAGEGIASRICVLFEVLQSASLLTAQLAVN